MELLALHHHWLTYETHQNHPKAYSVRPSLIQNLCSLSWRPWLAAGALSIALVLSLMTTVARAITAFVEVPQANVRDSPSTSGGIVRVVVQGDRIDVTQITENGWTQLSDGNWILTESFRSGSGSGIPAVVNVPEANVRDRPDNSASIVRQVSNGERIETTDISENGYTQLTDGNWIANGTFFYVDSGSGSDSDSWGLPAIVAVEQLTARWQPSPDAGRYRTLSSGDQVFLTGNILSTGWVELIDGTWVLGSQLDPPYGNLSVPPPEQMPEQT
ncbi:MAG: hypothetical protein AAF728_07735, partial [Cyanobacteria bacterium P01_D01_bin.128]